MRLPACLAALESALAALPRRIRRLAVIVLDACTDDSQLIVQRCAAHHPDWRCLKVEARNVGQARALGMHRALDELAGVPRVATWLATTDADSTVPSHWLTDQLDLAASGAQAIAGTIHVADWHGYPDRFGARFVQYYARRGSQDDGSADDHPHVHGTNLGVRADAYLAVGGFAPLPSGEDHALWQALRAAAVPCVATRAIEVVTSARRHGRAPAGFSKFLRDLEYG